MNRLLLSLCMLVWPTVLLADDLDFKSLFNGKDLTDWEGDAKLWSVKDGAITGITDGNIPNNSFIIWKGMVANFELKLKFKCVGGNSGVQYRSKRVGKNEDYIIAGYQADIDSAVRKQQFVGILYEERGRGFLADRGQKIIIDANGDRYIVGDTGKPDELLAAVKGDDWNDYHIIANGNTFKHIINGKTMIEVIDHQKDKRATEGLLAFQIHRGMGQMTIQFKDILLKKLPEGGEVTLEKMPIPKEAKKIEVPKAEPKKKEPKKKDPQPKPVVGKEPSATDPITMKVAKDFKLELLYSVPKTQQGSWVSMCTDPKGRLIVCDQYGGLYRVVPPALNGKPEEIKIDKIPVDLGEAQGLLWAFDSLYVMVNRGGKYESGLYRVRDTNNDDQLDEVKQLRKLEGGGEHGPHAVLVHPDGKSLVVICGNHTNPTKFDRSFVPQIWKEDHLLPRMWDAGGHAVGRMAPGGWIAKTDPDGKEWELLSIGYRNAYDMAYNRHGELFTYDSDMEWDMNTPWYRPTRVCQAVSGSEFGWRSGTGKWPVYYPDNLPATINIGPGSPTGVCFGYGAKFPAKYQDALFICDWSYGKLYAIHLTPEGSTYRAEAEEFIAGTPLPLTDIVVNPKDGAMYFAIGGRKTKSGLYRVTYTGKESTEPSKGNDTLADQRAIRHSLEAFHGKKDPKAVETVWKYLAHPDRFIRFAARTALEFQDVNTWSEKALAEKNPQAALEALLALTRRVGDESLQDSTLLALERLHFSQLNLDQQLALLRVYGLVFIRMGEPSKEIKTKLASKFDLFYPSKQKELNAELCQLLVYLESPLVARKTLDLIKRAPTQEEQLDYIKSLRMLKTGWNSETRKEYFTWFTTSSKFKGGHSFDGFIRNIKTEAVAMLSEEEKYVLKEILETKMDPKTIVEAKQRPFVKQWKLDELVGDLDQKLVGRDYDRGRTLFAETTCFSCHRYDNEGGAQGPDLTGVAGRFSPRDLLESILEPSKTISDQYESVNMVMDDGKTVSGRIVNLNDDNIMVMTNMLDPKALTGVNRRRVESIEKSKVSMMPTGLLDTLNKDEIYDLLAYVLSRGDRKNKMFKP